MMLLNVLSVAWPSQSHLSNMHGMFAPWCLHLLFTCILLLVYMFRVKCQEVWSWNIRPQQDGNGTIVRLSRVVLMICETLQSGVDDFYSSRVSPRTTLRTEHYSIASYWSTVVPPYKSTLSTSTGGTLVPGMHTHIPSFRMARTYCVHQSTRSMHTEFLCS